mgnify:FL=1|jgi:hypothetical protein
MNMPEEKSNNVILDSLFYSSHHKYKCKMSLIVYILLFIVPKATSATADQ